MKIEVLLATMFYENEPKDFLDKMNIRTDIIIADQCDKTGELFFKHGDNSVTVLSSTERGVGKNRNSALEKSTADIILFADNDVTYYDGYAEKIEKFYTDNPSADVVIFNFKESRNGELPHDINLETKKAKLKDVTKFGAYAISAKRQSILSAGIKFSVLFGGGCKYGSGEDTVFLVDCFKKKLSVYLCRETLGEVTHGDSTWYRGINEKYVFDKGALFKAICPRLYRLAITRHVIKYKKLYSVIGTTCKVRKNMIKGAKDYKNTIKVAK